MPVCEIHLKFINCDDPVVIKDVELIKRVPLLLKTMEKQPNWETSDTIVLDLPIPIPIEGHDFVFSFVRKYEKPTMETKLEDYAEANAKSLEELRQINRLAFHLECFDFMHSITFVMSKKLEKLSVDEVAEFFATDAM